MGDCAIDDRPLELADLATHLAEGARAPATFRVGAEHEKFGFRLGSNAPVPYYGDNGIEALLKGLMRFGWAGLYEPGETGEVLIGLIRDGAGVSLEPGGQFELSGAPLETIHDICRETSQHLRETKAVADELGLGFLGLGFNPTLAIDQVPAMPKGRYKIMRAYMPKVGTRGLDMMFRTCTVQANLDYGSEADMVEKFRVSLALQPVATALFANSPFTEDGPTDGCRRGRRCGSTPTRTAPVCWISCSARASASATTPPMRSTCLCISSSATAATSTPRASRSAPSWRASYRPCRASARP